MISSVRGGSFQIGRETTFGALATGASERFRRNRDMPSSYGGRSPTESTGSAQSGNLPDASDRPSAPDAFAQPQQAGQIVDVGLEEGRVGHHFGHPAELLAFLGFTGRHD